MKHILIDFENVQPEPEQLAELDDEQCHIWLFLGRLQQRVLSVELCEALCRFGKNVHFVKVARIGKNALDFYLAYYLGKITEQDTEALICILSRDGGFDILVEHLNEQQHCRGIVRLARLSEAAKSEEALLEAASHQPTTILPNHAVWHHESPVIQAHDAPGFIQYCFKKTLKNLMPTDAFRPVVQHNLESRLQNVLLKDDLIPYNDTQQEEVIALVLDKLMQRGFLSINPTNSLLEYHLSDADLLDMVIQHLLTARPNHLDGAKQVLKLKADSLYLESNDDDLMKIIEYCQTRQLLRIQNRKIEYAPFDEPAPSVPLEVIISPAEDAYMMEKVNLFFTSHVHNKPMSKISLTNSLRNILHLSKEQLEMLINRLIQQKQISIDATGRVKYL